MIFRKSQAGATLLITLVALIIVTVLALVAIRSSFLMMKIAGNAETLAAAEAAAQYGIDAKIASIDSFKTPWTSTATVGSTIRGKKYIASLPPPACLNSVIAPGYSLLYSSPPVDQTWNFSASAADATVSGTNVTVTQGIKVRMPVGSNCPN